MPGLVPPQVRAGCEHVYYLFPILYKEDEVGVSRSRFVEALIAEGIPFYARAAGYVKPYYLEPMFTRRTVYANGSPFDTYEGEVDYSPGICPVTERLYNSEMIMNTYCYPPLTTADMDDIADAFEKVLANVDKLK
jgi:dTDP-4-amino-4,6-dideoxygalactose transaminase